MAGPKMTDTNLYLNAGINPRTKAPTRLEGTPLKDSIKKVLRIIDEQDALNRFTWYNLPDGLTGQLLERILYYRGQGIFFYIKEMDKFYFLPYTLNGNIDVYGRFTAVTPLPFNGSTSDKEDGAQTKLKVWLSTQVKIPQYEVVMPQDLTIDHLYDDCVILKDYSEQISQTNISRQVLNDPVLDIMSDCIPFMRTALMNSTGVEAMRVGSQDEQSNVESLNNIVYDAALNGKRAVAAVGTLDFQNLSGGSTAKSEEFLLALQSLDNFRLSLYGIDNGGLFQKKAHMLQSEQDMAGGSVGLVLQDSLTRRQEFCNIINSIWGLGIWCDVSETISGTDKNLDGQLQDNKDQSGQGNNEPEVDLEEEDYDV